MSEVKPGVKALTPKVLVLGLIISLLWISYHGATPVIGWSGLWPLADNAWADSLLSIWIIMMILMAVLPKASEKLGLSPQEYVALYTFGMMAGPICTFFVGLGYLGALRMQTSPQYEPLWDTLPSFLRVDKDVINAFYVGGPLDYSQYAPYLAWWTTQGIILMLFLIFVSATFRRAFLEVEAIPFPYGEAAARIIETHTAPVDRPAVRLTVIGFILSFIATFFSTGGLFSKIYTGWPGYPLSQNLTSVMEKTLPGCYFVVDVNFHWIAIFYLLPVTTLLSGWLFYVIGDFILVPALVMAGVIPWDPTLSGWAKWTIIHGRYGWPALLFFAMGCIYASIIFGFYVSRRQILASLRAIVNPTEDDKREALPYRYLWIGSIVLFFVFAATYTVFGIPYHLALFIALEVIWFQFCSMRQRGRGAPPFEYWRAPSVDYAYGVAHTLGIDKPGDPLTYYFIGWGENAGGYYLNLSGGYLGYALETYKVGMLHNVRPRDIFIIQIITSVLVATLVVPQILYWGHRYGIYNTPGKDMLYRSIGAHPWLTIGKGVYDGNPYSEWMGASYPAADIMTIVGIIFGLIAAFLRLRYVFLPVDPIGFAIVLISGGFWCITFIAWLLKYLTIKIAGSRTYEYKGIPLATGVALGSILHLVLNIIAGAVVAGWIP